MKFSVSKYDVRLAQPSIGGLPGVFKRTGSFLVNPYSTPQSRLRERPFQSASNLDDTRTTPSRSSSRHSFVSALSDEHESNISHSTADAEENDNDKKKQGNNSKHQNLNDDDHDNINNNASSFDVPNSPCPRCVEERSARARDDRTSASSSSRAPKRRRDDGSKERRLSARNALFDSGRRFRGRKEQKSSEEEEERDGDACSCASESSYHTVAEEVDLFPYFELDPAWLHPGNHNYSQ